MLRLVESIKNFFEKQAFGICEFWGERFGIKSANIRLFFIYTSFLTVGSPIIIYLVMGFWMNLKKLMKRNRGSVWDL
jgi:phage shock protein PspC (stress-responsive transcriptional regulator)